MTDVVRTYVRGFDGELAGGIPKGHVVLVRGASGTMKSSFSYAIAYHNARKSVRGLYVTLEQEASGLLQQMAALGLRPQDVSDSLPVLDLSRGREHIEKLAEKMKGLTAGKDERPITSIFKSKIDQLRKQIDFDLLIIDSWNALELALEFQDRRSEVFDLFEWLRDLKCTTFLIAETPDGNGDDGLEEEFLADAIFNLKLAQTSETAFQRRIQCSKMRSANHSTDFFTLVFEGDHFEVAKAIS